jgi:uncharacterized phage protein (TIGR01671 family)
MNRIIKFRAWNSQQNLMVEDANWLVDKNINAAILMQFTGLKDKNGKEIFEGDIIIGNPQSDVITERIFIIGWMNSCWCLIHTESKEVLCSISAYYIEAVEKWATVISNIYENPELIKQDGQ